MESKLQQAEEKLRMCVKDPKMTQPSGRQGKGNSQLTYFKKFKEDERSKTILQRLELTEQEEKHAEEKSRLEQQIH